MSTNRTRGETDRRNAAPTGKHIEAAGRAPTPTPILWAAIAKAGGAGHAQSRQQFIVGDL